MEVPSEVVNVTWEQSELVDVTYKQSELVDVTQKQSELVDVTDIPILVDLFDYVDTTAQYKPISYLMPNVSQFVDSSMGQYSYI